jgi:hypothetical protein
MKAIRISGTENYAEEAPELLKRYESISFADHHRLVMHLIPTVPGRVLDIGAGTGRDAAGFVGLGHSVVAVVSGPRANPPLCVEPPCKQPKAELGKM